jgi:hypothetical protein
MKLDSLDWCESAWIPHQAANCSPEATQLVLLFGDSASLQSEQAFEGIRQRYPRAFIVGVSTSGNIHGSRMSESGLYATAMQLESSSIVFGHVDLDRENDMASAVSALVAPLKTPGLKHVLLFSDGLSVNGSELLRQVNHELGDVPITGGMAGDGIDFQRTWVIANAPARSNQVAAIGFVGDALCIRHGYSSGWSPFGHERRITRSRNNVLFELDHKPALDLYRDYLGEYADDLPASGMRFPLNIRAHETACETTRTLLGIDEKARSITFAGDVPEGYIARLMRHSIDELIDGAGTAANAVRPDANGVALGLAVSCVGRRVVMNQLVDEELEHIAATLGPQVQLCGFYSYGEFAPFQDNSQRCQLHNQTLVLTTIHE